MIRRFVRFLCLLFAIYLFLVLVLTALFRFVPPVSAVMVTSVLRGDGATRDYVPLSRISPSLIRAVIVSEDSAFCTHHGIDWRAVDKAINQGGQRGASTITMQVVKNLYLWNGRSWIRKAIEAPLALALDLAWPKWRILEVYLNIAEWGDGVFGIEAAAQHQFGSSARYLSATQSAQLVTMLPDPTGRSARNPGPAQQQMASDLLGRMGREGANIRCLTR